MRFLAVVQASYKRPTFRAIPFIRFNIFVLILTFITYNLSRLVFNVFMFLQIGSEKPFEDDSIKEI